MLPVGLRVLCATILFVFRSGKRTFYGLIKDGYNSAIRYYYNNFSDGYRQVYFHTVIYYVKELHILQHICSGTAVCPAIWHETLHYRIISLNMKRVHVI